MKTQSYPRRPGRVRLHLKRISGRPDLTPVVDVIFLLLIFFMLSSSFVQVSGIEVSLPQTETVGAVGIGKSNITIASTGNGPALFFNDRPVALENLSEELGKLRADYGASTIILRADERIPYGTVAAVAAIAQKVNFGVLFVTMPVDRSAITFGPNEN